MESLASYYSDEEEELSTVDTTIKPEPPCSTEDNYDPVGMEMSDDDESQDSGTFPAHPLKSKDGSEDHKGMPEKTISVSRTSSNTSHKTSDRSRNLNNDLNRWRTNRSQDMSSKTRTRSPGNRISRSRSRSRSRSQIKSENQSRSSSRSQSRSRSRSRSRSVDRNHESRSPRDRREHYHKRSGNGERYRDRSPHRRPYDRVAANKMCILEKLGIELKVPEKEKTGNKYYETFGQNSSRFLEQIAKRKMLWNKNQPKVNPAIDADKEPASKKNQWKDARFSQDQDGKMTAKFHRLMGMKTSGGSSSSNETDKVNKETTSIKQQEELFSTMEMQYEAARNATHKQRGVGLGFSSHHLTR